MANNNPFGTQKTGGVANVTAVPDYPQADTADYAVPSGGNTQYITSFGYAYRLSSTPSAQQIPSAQRLGAIPREDFRPVPNRPPEEFWGPLDADRKTRESVTSQKAVPWPENKGTQYRMAPNPRSVPPPEPRITTQLSPATYSFVRPFDQFNREWPDSLVGTTRQLNGTHFSMADHRRNYEILGMRPPMARRNTYRLEPGAWDENIVDMPPTPAQAAPSIIQSVELPPNSRTHRLM